MTNQFPGSAVAFRRRPVDQPVPQGHPWVLRALRDISNEQFVSDKILTAQFYTDSGSIGYETSGESIYADRGPAAVPGGEYPITPLSTGRPRRPTPSSGAMTR